MRLAVDYSAKTSIVLLKLSPILSTTDSAFLSVVRYSATADSRTISTADDALQLQARSFVVDLNPVAGADSPTRAAAMKSLAVLVLAAVLAPAESLRLSSWRSLSMVRGPLRTPCSSIQPSHPSRSTAKTPHAPCGVPLGLCLGYDDVSLLRDDA